VNDTAKATWWNLTDTARMMTEDWTLNWCKGSCCIKQQQNKVEVHSEQLMQVS